MIIIIYDIVNNFSKSFIQKFSFKIFYFFQNPVYLTLHLRNIYT